MCTCVGVDVGLDVGVGVFEGSGVCQNSLWSSRLKVKSMILVGGPGSSGVEVGARHLCCATPSTCLR